MGQKQMPSLVGSWHGCGRVHPGMQAPTSSESHNVASALPGARPPPGRQGNIQLRKYTAPTEDAIYSRFARPWFRDSRPISGWGFRWVPGPAIATSGGVG
jgi:hypothetical protein